MGGDAGRRRGIDRRRFLALSAAATLAPSALLGAGRGGAPAPGIGMRRFMLRVGPYGVDAETPVELLTDYITPNDLFFVLHHGAAPADADSAIWTLIVDGDVATPLRLTLDDLRGMPASEATCVLQCAGNGRALFEPPISGVQWTYGAIGNARWTGVRLRDLLARAGLKRAARHLHTFGGDAPSVMGPRFDRSLPIDKAIEDGLVAYAMNGEPLPFAHGGPARLVVPGWAGAHWMKWLRQLTAARAPQTGYYMESEYRYPKKPGVPGAILKPGHLEPVTALLVKSTIAQAPLRARAGSSVELRGFAFSGAPDIAKVEISDDDGRTWRPANLDPRHDPYAWRLWSYRFTPGTPGSVALLARATDSAGSVQPRESVWNQGGYLYNGWHQVTIEVTS